MSCDCMSDAPVKLIYACSGVANTGFLADRVARGLMQIGLGKMTCLAAMGADHSGFVESAKAADENIVIDGCPVSCGKRIFEQKNISFTHLKTTDFGVEKGKTKIDEELVKNVQRYIAERLLGLEETA
ncbi:MAG: putative zinc-binding protein [Spirochaetales bacterium]|nr:putative zinc-binding protein [Spirochaetales bacterium]MCF7939564.1 putative zinc-binding protein [Spirochaetales bacterium]